MTSLRVGSLCTGYGGLDLAIADVLDIEHVWQADPDPDASKVLTHRFPDVPNLGDITAINWPETEPVDIIAAGFPCQGISNAGLRLGLEDSRSGIWSNVADAVRVLRPRLVVLENVSALLGRGMGRVIGDLAEIGYVGSWACVRASDVGAPHRRERTFIVAWPADTEGNAWRLAHGDGRGATGKPGRDGLTLLPTPTAERVGSRMDTQLSGDGRTTPNKLGWAVSTLLPTPRVTDTNGAGTHGSGGLDLRTAVSFLPTPQASDGKRGSSESEMRRNSPALAAVGGLPPTPRATDGTHGGPNQRGSRGDLMLPSAVMLMPTPTSTNSHGNHTNNRGDLLLPGVVADADRWGQYAPAIARWEAVTGRPAPEPTELGTKGNQRLSARFVEWLMGCDDGWVTDVPGLTRNAQLARLGNGVVRQQGAYALRRLLAVADVSDSRSAA